MNTTIYKIGFYAGVIAFVANAAFVVVQILQLLGVLTYPYDQILIFSFSLCIVIPFLLEMLAFHHSTTEHKRIWTHAALIFTIIYAVFVIANYAVQIATIKPLTVNCLKEFLKL